jgi:hypothetical protein
MQTTGAHLPASTLENRKSSRWHAALRLLLAIPAGYGWTALATGFLARVLPLPALEATIAATLASFALYAAIIVWVVHARYVGRAALLMALTAAAMAGSLWIAIAGQGRL